MTSSAPAPLLSVIVPTTNRPHRLRRALRSVADQADVDLAEVEVLVINDGDRDVCRILHDQLDGVATAWEIRLGGEVSSAEARNVGLEEATGKYVAFLDDDSVFLPHHVATALAALDDEYCKATVSASYYANGEISLPSPAGEYRLPRHHTIISTPPEDSRFLNVWPGWPLHAVVFTRPTDIDLPEYAFDTTLNVLDDWGFWLRLHREQWYDFACLTEPGVVTHCNVPIGESETWPIASETEVTEYLTNTLHIWGRHGKNSNKNAAIRLYVTYLYASMMSSLAQGQGVVADWQPKCRSILIDSWNNDLDPVPVMDRLREAYTNPDADVLCLDNDNEKY